MLFCYNVPPIDFWTGALDERQFLASAWVGCHQDWGQMAQACSEVAGLQRAAEIAFKEIGWEGDVREGPFYFALPGHTALSIGYMIKQDNNGNCFVASPEELPHLDELAIRKIVAKRR